MNRKPHRYGILMVAISVVVALCLSLLAYFSPNSSPLSNIAGITATPTRTARTAISRTLQSWSAYVNGYNELLAEKNALEQKLAEYETAIREAEEIQAENRRLRQFLELREQRRDLQFAISSIIQQDTSNWSDLLTLDCGTNDDVSVGDCVVDPCGHLVGIVFEVGLNWANVRTIVDTKSSVGAKVFRTDSLALAVGSFSLMADKRLQLNFLGSLPDVMEGDLITTSGLGGYLPPSLVIGYVEGLRTGEDGSTQYAVVRPAADFQQLTQLFVITDFEIVR